MAYGLRYRFKFENIRGVVFDVLLYQDGYSGTVTDRPLGAAPVIRMKTSGPFRATSCDLVLECQEDGEFADLYTSNPREFRVDIKRGQILIWTGFVATELYSEPDIYPPYDVRVTATDGLGVLKEYDFVPAGPRTIRAHLKALLAETGLDRGMYSVFSLHEPGDTVAHFLDNILIDLDYHEGDTVYDVLSDLLTTLRCTITQWGEEWLLIRDNDVAVNSRGRVPGHFTSNQDDVPTYDLDLAEDMTAEVGKMGVADMWPVGYLTRSVVPAKKSVSVKSEWHLKNGALPIADWNGSGDFARGSQYWTLGILGGTGIMANSMDLFAFRHDIRVTVKVSALEWGSSYGYPWMKVIAAWVEGGTTYYFDRENGWNTSGSATDDEHRVNSSNWSNDPELAETIEVIIPAKDSGNAGYIAVNVQGHRVKVYDVKVEVLAGGGYRDRILIGNGARGSAPEISISGGRELALNLFPVNFLAGVFYRGNGSSASDVVTAFSDGDNTNKDYMTLTALNYAKTVAGHRIEISGKLDIPLMMFWNPMVIKSHGVWAVVESYDLDLVESEMNFKAVTIPSTALLVDSEEITSLPNQ